MVTSIVDYSRQKSLDQTLERGMTKNELQVIMGCGGVGYWLGIQLAMLGYEKFVLIDGGLLDHSNLNRLPVPQTWVGLNKAVALRKIIRFLRPGTIITTLTKHINENNLNVLNALDFINLEPNFWDTTDNAIIQTKIYKYLKRLGLYPRLKYRKLGYEEFKIGAYNNYSIWTDEDYQPGYRTSNANVVTSTLCAGLGIFAKCLTEEDVEFNIKELIKKGEKK